MIKYYDTLAAYEADVKSAFESQVALIGADNTVKYDGRNVVIGVQSAKTGSIAILDGNHAMRFISVDTFSSESFFSDCEVVGIVWVGVDHPEYRGRIVIYGQPSNEIGSEIYSWELKGYVLDGTDHSGVLSIREVSDSWAANHDYTVTYNATDVEGLAGQLNAFFKSNEPFTTQGWVATPNGNGYITLVCYYKNYQQAGSNKGTSGFSLSGNFLPELIATQTMLRRNGQRTGEGTIVNMDRALAYFKQDLTNTAYNPSVDVTSVKIRYPICLPAYLGTSQYQSDHCSYLRSYYGEGEEGWKEFMKSFLPVRPTEFGTNGDKAKYGDAIKNTAYLAMQYYTDINGEVRAVLPMVQHVVNYGFDNEICAKGKWVLPDSDLMFDVSGGITYPTTNDRYAEVRNRALAAVGWPAFGNNFNVWSCSRWYTSNFWCVGGGYGCASGYVLAFRLWAVPLLLLDMPQSAN